jgi:ferritin-like metal-binding protein YciE
MVEYLAVKFVLSLVETKINNKLNKDMPTKTASKKNSVKQDADTLRTLFEAKIKALYDIETQLVKALPKMAKSATNSELKEGFTDHLTQTEGHVDRLGRIFESMEVKPQKLACDAIRGLIADAEWVIKNTHGAEALDAGLIAAAQYVEHYEIGGYTAAVGWARLLNMDDAAGLLEQTLQEEKDTEETLENLADSEVDEVALGGEEKEGSDEN